MAFNIWDVRPDTPINNFATLNPLNTVSGTTLSEGNLKIVTSTTGQGYSVATIEVNSGKFYAEYLALSTVTSVGVTSNGTESVRLDTNSSGVNGFSYFQDGNVLAHQSGTVHSNIGTYANGDVIGVYLNLDSAEVSFYKNNNLQGTITSLVGDSNYTFMFGDSTGSAGSTGYVNFGQDPTFNGSKTPTKVYTDSNGQGRFFYEPPAGALALCTRNLATPKNVPAEYIVDETNQHLLTYNGNAQISKFSPYATDGYSLDGMSTGINIGVPSNLISGTGDWSFESWVFLERHVDYNSLFSTRTGNDYSGGGANIGINGTISVILDYNGASPWDFNQSSSNTVPLNKWVHICIERYSGDCNVYIDGVKETIGSFGANSLYASTFKIGREEAPGNQNFKGHMSDIRIKTGGSFYNGTVTVPDASLSSTDSALHISSNSKQIIDSSTNSYSLTLTASPEISDWSPYTSIDKQTGYELVTTENGGSFYFSGTSYIDASPITAIGTGDYTIEAWVYHTDISGQQTYTSDTYSGQAGIYFYKNPSHQIGIYYTSQIITGSTVLKANQWYHICVKRESGQIYLYVNGVSDATPVSDTLNLTETIFTIGDSKGTSSGTMKGYISDLRFNHSAVTPSTGGPTSKLSSIANTKLLLQPFQPKDTVNSSFFNVTDNYAQDETGKALTYVGNAAVSASSPYKSGDYGSFAFSANTQAIIVPATNNFNGDILTIEYWLKFNGTSTRRVMRSSTDGDNFWEIAFDGTWGFYFRQYDSNAMTINQGLYDQWSTSNNWQSNAWTHFVFQKNGSTWSFYKNGKSISLGNGSNMGAATTIGNYNTLLIGNTLNFINGLTAGDYITDLRIVKGQALYTADFTPPAYPLLSNNYTTDGSDPANGTTITGTVLLAQPGKVADSENVAAKDPDAYMKMSTWVGDGTTSRTVPHNLGFDPDLVWIKNRDVDRYALIVDSVRDKYNSTDGYKILVPSRTESESISNWSANYRVIDKSSTDFTFNGGVSTNESGKKFIAWCWKAGGTPSGDDKGVVDGVERTITGDSKLDSGTITPTRMSVNTKAGFSIVKYTGNSTGVDSSPVDLIPHGLNSPPEFFILKDISRAGSWNVGISNIIGTNDRYTRLNSVGTIYSNIIIRADSNLILLDHYNAENSVEYIAYCWHSVPGYSATGTWEGNGTTGDGPFVYTGFKPAFIIHVNLDSGTGAWAIIDSVRDSYNPVSTYLYPNTDADESTTTTSNPIDFLSNGFKMRGSGGTVTNNQTNLYMAFAEAPTPYATAR